jgi:N-acetylglucosamine kinase-like BadF-type ATPase
MQLLESGALKALLAVLPCQAGRVGLFLAGCATEPDRRKLERLARSLWPQAGIRVGSDRQSGFAAAFGDGDGIAVIAGTGSAVTGRNVSNEDGAGAEGRISSAIAAAAMISPFEPCGECCSILTPSAA